MQGSEYNIYAVPLSASEWADIIEFLYPIKPEGEYYAEKLLDALTEAISLERWTITEKGLRALEEAEEN